jgi:hypothetical protein
MINYNDKHFGMLSTSTGASNETVFHYQQAGDVVWGTYAGGSVIRGTLLAKVDAAGVLDLRFAHVKMTGEIVTGVSISTPEVLPDGRIRLIEDFQFTSGDKSKGVSMVEEIAE